MSCKPLKKSTLRSLARLSFYILLGLVLYLSVKPNPAIQEIRWMPRDATVFFDLHDGWKNAVGYGMLALAGFIGWPRSDASRRRKRWARMLFQGLGFCAIVVGMELLQVFIPTRFCDIKDMTAGSFGVGIAWMIAALGESCGKLAKPGRPRSQNA